MNPDKPNNEEGEELPAEVIDILDGLPPREQDILDLADPGISGRVVKVIQTPDQNNPGKDLYERENQKPLSYTERKILETVETLRELHQKLSGSENARLRETIGRWMFELSGSKDKETAQKINNEMNKVMEELHSEHERLHRKICIRRSTRKNREERISYLKTTISEIEYYFEYIKRLFSRIFSQRRKRSTRVKTQIADVEAKLRERNDL
ncbi:hypothetical protein GF366_00055 [Candidatus Peregrinibacteria bacterium]|nr:hypothetical protein [Candidatus Peregrinibacteria bacterium]